MEKHGKLVKLPSMQRDDVERGSSCPIYIH